MPLAQAIAAGDPNEVLGTYEELFPSESMRRNLTRIFGWKDGQQLKRSDFANQPMIMLQQADFVMGKKDAESLGYLSNLMLDLHVMGKYSNPMKDQSWRIEDMDAFWNSVAKWDKIPSFTMLYPEWKDGANQTLNLKFPLMPKVTMMQLSGWSRSSSLANPITKVFKGSDINPDNLPALTYLRWEDVALDDWTPLAGLKALTKLEITGGDMKDASFISGMTGLTDVVLSSNALLDFTPFKPLIDNGNLKKLSLSNQDRYMVGDEGFTMWGDMDEISIPLSVIDPDGNKMGADKFTGTQVVDKKLTFLPDGQLPEGIRYDEATHSFVLTRAAAEALPVVTPSCLGRSAKMFIFKFSCPIPGFTDASGKVWIEINVTDAVPAKPLNHAPVINATDLTLTVGDEFDPKAGVTATDNEDGVLEFVVEKNDVDTSKAGTYQVTYMATDSIGTVTRKTITVTVKEAPKPAKPAKPAKPSKKPALPATGDPAAMAVAASGIAGIAGIASALGFRRRK